jgi:hypothetical protein
MASSCMLCVRPVAEHTALCEMHLEGFKLACVMLKGMHMTTTASILLSLAKHHKVLQQPISNINRRMHHGQSE